MANQGGSTTFNTFAYLRAGAVSLFQSATEQPEGSGYCRVAAVLFATFSIEATLNHIGEEKLPDWSIVERRLSWKDKLELIDCRLNMGIDRGQRPFQALHELFQFRDRLAHGKTQTRTFTIQVDDSHSGISDPEWLARFQRADQLNRVREDTDAMIEFLLEKASMPPLVSYPIATGGFVVEQRPGADRIFPDDTI